MLMEETYDSNEMETYESPEAPSAEVSAELERIVDLALAKQEARSKVRRKKYVIAAAAVIAAAVLGAAGGYHAGKSVPVKQEAAASRVKQIDYEDFQLIRERKEDFFLLIARPSCKYCAIVDDYIFNEMPDPGKPFYYLNLEEYRLSLKYEHVKEDLDIDFVPTIQYFEDGRMLYNMNNPLDGDYFDNKSNESLLTIHRDMEQKIQAFIEGANGTGPVVNEEISRPKESAEVVTAVPDN